MLKFELRKLAIFTLSIAVVTMVAACSGSSSSSSKSEPLVNPTANYLGAYQFAVDPAAESVQITPVGSPVSTTLIPGNGSGSINNITVSTMHGRNIWSTFTGLTKTKFTNIRGVELVSASATTPLGTGTLAYTTGTGLRWTAPGDAAGAAFTPFTTIGVGLVSPVITLTSGAPSATTIQVRIIRGCGTGNLPCMTVTATDANIQITKADPNWNGTDTISFDAKIAWNDPNYELANVRLAVKQYTDNNIKLLNYSQCTGVNWSTCGGTPAAVTYVSDDSSEGAATYRVCNAAGTCSAGTYYEAILQDCGSVVGHWTLQGTGGAAYKFWAYLYGDKKAVGDITTDVRYDDNEPTIYIRTYKLGTNSTAYPAEGAASKSMAAGEWFYVHYYVDGSGNNRPLPLTGDNNTDVGRIEDTGNLAQYAGGGNSTASYWFVDAVQMAAIHFDPAYLEIMSRGTNPYDPPSQYQNNKFATMRGTVLKTVTNSGTMWAYEAAWTNLTGASSTNRIGVVNIIGPSYSNATFPYPGSGSRGFATVSGDHFRLTMHAKQGVQGGAFIRPRYDGTTIIQAKNTMGNPGAPAGVDWAVPRSTQTPGWPNWCYGDMLPNYSTCSPLHMSFYNAERQYVCIN